MTEYNKKLLCKDCKHSKTSLLNKLIKNPYFFKCTAPEAWVQPIWNPVTGTTEPGKFRSAGDMRIYSDCGPEGKLWVPNSTKKVFLFLQET